MGRLDFISVTRVTAAQSGRLFNGWWRNKRIHIHSTCLWFIEHTCLFRQKVFLDFRDDSSLLFGFDISMRRSILALAYNNHIQKGLRKPTSFPFRKNKKYIIDIIKKNDAYKVCNSVFITLFGLKRKCLSLLPGLSLLQIGFYLCQSKLILLQNCILKRDL